MLHQLSWIKISVLFFLCCAVANLRSEEDHSDKEAISKFTSKSCHKTRTAQCNINLFTFSCLHVAFHFLWTKRHEIVGRHMEEEWCVWACSRAHTIGSWNVDTTVKTWLCQDYDINFDCFFFTLSLSCVDIFSSVWCRRLYRWKYVHFRCFFVWMHYKNTTPLSSVHAFMWDA